MSCEINLIACLEDIGSIRRCLFPTDDKRGSDTWLQQCKVSASPTGEIIALANERRLVVLTSKYEPSDSLAHFQISFSGSIHQYDKVKSILCLPIVNEHSKGSQISPEWTCILIGYDSGYIRFYTENCELIFEDQLHSENITSVKCQSQHTARPDYCQDLRNEEIYVQYKSVLCVVSGNELFSHLRKCRSQLLKDDSKTDTELNNFTLSIKKWGFQDQSSINDSSVVGLNLSNTFDHLLTASTCGGFDAKYRTVAPHSTLVLAAGTRPFLGYHYAVEGVNQPVLSDVAKVVATRLKSALPGWFSSTNTSQENKKITSNQPIDGMSCRFGLCDLHRVGNDIILTANRKVAVVSDSLGRVLIVDAYRGNVVKILKGYREAQCAIIQVPDEKHSKHKIGNRVANFLVIYSPKKGTLEIFTIQNGYKVATFSAAKYSRLIYVDYNLMGFTSITKSKYISQFTVVFIDCDGNIKDFMIPFHFALEENSSRRVRDIHLYRKMREIMKNENFSGDDIKKIYIEFQTLEIRNQSVELMMNNKNIKEDVFIECIEYYLDNLSDMENVNLKNFVTLSNNVIIILKLYEFINNSSNMQNNTNEKMSIIDLNIKEFKNLQRLLDLNVSNEKNDTKERNVHFQINLNNSNICTLFKIFNLNDNDTISLKSDADHNDIFKTGTILYEPYIKGNLSNFNDLKEKITHSKIPTKDLLFILISYWVNRPLNLDTNLENEMNNLSKIIETIVSTASKEILEIDYSDISQFWDEIRKILANTSKPFPALIVAILCKSIAHKIENDFANSEDDNIEILSQENVEWSILIGKLEDVSLLNIILSIKISNGEVFLPKLKFDKIEISLKFVLDKGRGVVSELVSQWLASNGINPENIVKNQNENLEKNIEPIFEYLNILKAQFPYSLEASTLLANICWEYSLAWQKNIENIIHLEASIKCLKCIENFRIKNGMYQLVWNTHLKILIESACKLINKVGKLPKEKLCRQNTGLSDIQISQFILICTEFLDEFLDVAQNCSDTPNIELHFEQIWDNENSSLVELAAQQKDVDFNLIHLHYQLALVLQMITKFSIKHSKPVNTLFETSVISLFFTDMQKKVNITTNNTDTKICNARTQFLCKVILASLETVTINDRNVIYCSEHVDWMSKCVTLAQIWNLDVDFLKRYQITQLYASGFDIIGEELISAISDQNSLGLELMVVAAKRLLQFLSSSPDLGQNISALSPSLTRYMESLDNGQWYAPSGLSSISSLADHILRCIEKSKNHKEYKFAELLTEACANLEEINN